MSATSATSVCSAHSRHSTSFLRMAEALPPRSNAALPISPGLFLFVFKTHGTLYVTPNVDDDSMTRASAMKAFADTNRRIECMSRARVRSPTKKKKEISDVEDVWED